MRILMFVLLVIVFGGCTLHAMDTDKEPKLFNCTKIANNEYWAMFKVKDGEDVYIILDGTTDTKLLKVK